MGWPTLRARNPPERPGGRQSHAKAFSTLEKDYDEARRMFDKAESLGSRSPWLANSEGLWLEKRNERECECRDLRHPGSSRRALVGPVTRLLPRPALMV